MKNFASGIKMKSSPENFVNGVNVVNVKRALNVWHFQTGFCNFFGLNHFLLFIIFERAFSLCIIWLELEIFSLTSVGLKLGRKIYYYVRKVLFGIAFYLYFWEPILAQSVAVVGSPRRTWEMAQKFGNLLE